MTAEKPVESARAEAASTLRARVERTDAPAERTDAPAERADAPAMPPIETPAPMDLDPEALELLVSAGC